MSPDRVIACLEEHHVVVEQCLRDGQALLQDGDACQLKALGLIRWQLMRRLRAYQLFKHVEVFDPVIAAECELRRRQAERLKQNCIAIGEAYQAHVKRWTLTGPAHSWPAYHAETTTMVAAIRAHLAREAGDIATLLHGLHRTRQLR